MENYILSIDQGTTGTTLSLIDQKGQIKVKVNQEFRQIFPKPGWVEHDTEDIWKSIVTQIPVLLEKGSVTNRQIIGIGLTNQRETVAVWDRKSGRPLHNAIVWQCRRTSAKCDSLKKKGLSRLIKARTGLVLDPYFSASKLNWLMSVLPRGKSLFKSGQVAAGTIDTFMLWRLTSGVVHATDVSNASRTMLMSIKKCKWDDDLLKIFSLPTAILGEIKDSSGVLGHTKSVPGLPDGIPISGVAGDQQAALFGQACFSAGQAKCTFGTGSFLLMNSGNRLVKSKSGLLTTVAWRLSGESSPTYALEGGAFICGAVVQWLRDQLGVISSSSEIEKLANQVSSPDGVEFVPAFTGLGAPHWKPEARAMISGIHRGTGKAHIARAALESMALQNVDILVAMQRDLGRSMKELRVDGGAVVNDLLMQLQSDFLGKKVHRPVAPESTSLGAGFLAGLGIGFWGSKKELTAAWALERTFKPKLSPAKRNRRLKSWQTAVSRV